MQDNRQNLKFFNKNNSGLTSLRSMIKKSYKEEGIKGFYAGIKFDMFRILPSNMIIFLVYEFFKTNFKDNFAN